MYSSEFSPCMLHAPPSHHPWLHYPTWISASEKHPDPVDSSLCSYYRNKLNSNLGWNWYVK
jgi:hypothetical protein